MLKWVRFVYDFFGTNLRLDNANSSYFAKVIS